MLEYCEMAGAATGWKALGEIPALREEFWKDVRVLGTEDSFNQSLDGQPVADFFDASFLEMLDEVNEHLNDQGEEPIAFDSDCREGICGACGVMVNGFPPRTPGRHRNVPAPHAQVQRRGTITIEPWRATSLPVIKDLVVDRTPLDRIIEAGGFITVNTGAAPDANIIPTPKQSAEAGDGCRLLYRLCSVRGGVPQQRRQPVHRGQDLSPRPPPPGPGRSDTPGWSTWWTRWRTGFGSCTNFGECETACPKSISIDYIAWMNRDYVAAQWKNLRKLGQQAISEHSNSVGSYRLAIPRSSKQRKDSRVAQFLSEDHMVLGTDALNADSGFQSAMANVDLGLQFVVTDGPDGNVDYYLQVGDGSADLALGELDGADASVTSDYETSAAISKGEMNVQMAFMTGKIKVGGNMAKIMMNQGLLNEFARVQSGLDIAY